MSAKKKSFLLLVAFGLVALVIFGLCYDPMFFFIFTAMTLALTAVEALLSFFIFTALTLAWTAVAALPFLLLDRWGFRRHRSGRIGGRLLMIVSSLGLVAIAIAFLSLFVSSSPFFERVIAEGTSPAGREYAISQAWVDWFDGYDLQLFIRGKDGRWNIHPGGRDWHPLDHFKVIFAPNGTKPILLLEDGRIRDFKIGRPDEVLPSTLTIDKLHRRHQAANRKRRTTPYRGWNSGGIDPDIHF